MRTGKDFIEMSRTGFYDRENLCQYYFDKLGCIYHLCTPENHPLIFRCDDEFKIGMNLLGIATKAHPRVRIMTFELMSNHIHQITIGRREDIESFFTSLKRLISRCLPEAELSGFNMHLHEIKTLENLRNAIAYTNRNGSIIDPDVCPYTYQWGANRYYFNPEAKARYEGLKRKATTRQIREFSQSRKYDEIKDLYIVDGYISPMSFCAIDEGESLFRDARHYFTKVSRHIESYDEIARMIGEQIYYTDDDLFSVACTIAAKQYDCKIPSQLPRNQKIELAKVLHTQYNARTKQLQRMLKIEQDILTALFGKSTK